ncbi:MAG: PEP-CTERM sorting domain-containing protein [Kiritimatiellia bacterium]
MNTTTNIKTTLIRIAIGLAASVTPQLHAADWFGGTGDWTSAGADNWSLGTGVYPGDAANGAESAVLTTGGTINIGSGDNINLTANQNYQAATTTVNQSGGTFQVNTTVPRVGNTWNLSGGAMTFSNGVQFFSSSGGGEINVSGGTFSASAIQWRGLGDVTVSGGSFTTGVMDFGYDGSGSGSISVIGSSATKLEANTLKLIGGASPATANFTFDNSGVNFWDLIGGSATTLFIDNTTNLNVDLGTYDAVNGDNLFAYNRRDPGVSGTFDTANISITGDTFGGAFTLGSGPGSLNPGEYYIDYTADFDGGGAVVLYANNIPEPSTFVLLGIALLGVVAFGRRKSA